MADQGDIQLRRQPTGQPTLRYIGPAEPQLRVSGRRFRNV
jgi:hypothetical protein